MACGCLWFWRLLLEAWWLVREYIRQDWATLPPFIMKLLLLLLTIGLFANTARWTVICLCTCIWACNSTCISTCICICISINVFEASTFHHREVQGPTSTWRPFKTFKPCDPCKIRLIIIMVSKQMDNKTTLRNWECEIQIKIPYSSRLMLLN